MTDYDIALAIVDQCERHSVDLCDTYNSWITAAFALASLGEPGRRLFHRLSALSTSYNYRESDYKFTNVMRKTRSTVGSLIKMARSQGIETHSTSGISHIRRRVMPRPTPKPYSTIPEQLIARSTATDMRSNHLTLFLTDIFTPDEVSRVVSAYRIGSTRLHETIFPQIDTGGICRTGKIIAYNATDGHRDHNRGADWLHSRYMRSLGLTVASYDLHQCLFGQHLLASAPPHRPIGIVEAEKTAIIAAIARPDTLWLATGGKYRFDIKSLRPLAGRTDVTVYPDADASALWRSILTTIPFASAWTFSDWADNEPPESHRDIADLILSGSDW